LPINEMGLLTAEGRDYETWQVKMYLWV